VAPSLWPFPGNNVSPLVSWAVPTVRTETDRHIESLFNRSVNIPVWLCTLRSRIGCMPLGPLYPTSRRPCSIFVPTSTEPELRATSTNPELRTTSTNPEFVPTVSDPPPEGFVLGFFVPKYWFPVVFNILDWIRRRCGDAYRPLCDQLLCLRLLSSVRRVRPHHR